MYVEFTCYSLLIEYVTYKSMNIDEVIRYNYIVTASRIPYYISIPRKNNLHSLDVSSSITHFFSLGFHHLLLLANTTLLNNSLSPFSLGFRHCGLDQMTRVSFRLTRGLKVISDTNMISLNV